MTIKNKFRKKVNQIMMDKFKKIFQYNKSLIVCFNHALLGFYFCQFA